MEAMRIRDDVEENEQVASSKPLAPQVLPTESEVNTGRASALIDEQIENLIRYRREYHTKTKRTPRSVIASRIDFGSA